MQITDKHIIGAIAVVTLLTYSQFIGLQMLEFDATTNMLSHTGGLWDVLSTPEQDYSIVSKSYRPTPSIILWTMFKIFGYSPPPFHLLMILLHLFVTALVYLLGREIFKNHMASTVAALLFATHSVHVQTVLHVSRLPDMILTLSMVSTVLLLFKRKKQAPLTAAVGIWSKMTAAFIASTATLYYIIYTRGKTKKRIIKTVKNIIPYWLIVAVYMGVMYMVVGGLGGYQGNTGNDQVFNVLNFVMGITYPNDILHINPFQTLYAFLNQQPQKDILLPTLAIATTITLALTRKNRDLTFLISWTLSFPAIYLLAKILVSPWYFYAMCVPFNLLIGYTLAWSLKKSKPIKYACTAFVALFTVSIVFWSPIAISYEEPFYSGEIIFKANEAIRQAGKELDVGGKIVVLNTPEYMQNVGWGEPYALIMVREDSLQLLAEHLYPGKNITVFSGSSAHLKGDKNWTLTNTKTNNCIITSKTPNINSIKLLPTPQKIPNHVGRPRLAHKWGVDTTGRWIMVQLTPMENTKLVLWDGENFDVEDLSRYCN